MPGETFTLNSDNFETTRYLGLQWKEVARKPVHMIHWFAWLIIAVDTQKWHSQLLGDGNRIDNGNKLRTRKYKNSLTAEPYVTMNMGRGHRRILAEFRSRNIPVAVETGRYTKPKIPLAERLCKFCGSAIVAGEIHFLTDCEFYSDIRYELFHYANIINTDFLSLTSEGKLIYLIQNSALQINLALSLLLMNRQRRSAVSWRIAQTLLASAFL